MTLSQVIVFKRCKHHFKSGRAKTRWDNEPTDSDSELAGHSRKTISMRRCRKAGGTGIISGALSTIWRMAFILNPPKKANSVVTLVSKLWLAVRDFGKLWSFPNRIPKQELGNERNRCCQFYRIACPGRASNIAWLGGQGYSVLGFGESDPPAFIPLPLAGFIRRTAGPPAPGTQTPRPTKK